MRAFIYCRVSTKEQSTDDHYSLGNQQKRCTAYIKGRDTDGVQWRVHKVRSDVASGKNDEREGFRELRQLVIDKKIDVVVVYRLDRLSRNVRDIYDFLDLLRTNKSLSSVSTKGLTPQPRWAERCSVLQLFSHS
jgi:DNA invertase Pin-like site-specific DNA recombinase